VTLAVAHRGDPVAQRENTIPAFEAAVAAGADMVELDVWPSADGVAAVLHDETLDRLWNVPRRVGELTIAELNALGIPSLAEALDAIPVQVMVDYKDESAVDPALEAIRAADALERCVFAGENFAGHRRIRAQHADARIALTWNWPDRDPEPLLAELGAEFFNPDGRVLRENPAFLDRMRERGTAVSVWTLDERRHLEWALGLGVDAVITNRIHDLLELRTAC
jgi:glycerophosphoryl diester phosphodiesterase